MSKEIKRVLVHQANDKMDAAILERLFRLYDLHEIPADIMPMTIGWLGNSSVATLPTLLDLILKEKMPGHALTKGDKIRLRFRRGRDEYQRCSLPVLIFRRAESTHVRNKQAAAPLGDQRMNNNKFVAYTQ
jgi:hypothetical protein